MTIEKKATTRAEREAHVRRAWGNVAFEGVQITDDIKASAQRYIEGEITINEHVRECVDNAKRDLAEGGAG